MLKIKRFLRMMSLGPALFALGLLPAHGAPASPSAGTVLATSSVRLTLAAGNEAPRLAQVKGLENFLLLNRQEETLPASIELGGVSVPLTWQHNKSLDSIDSRHVVFVYESDHPRLRLRWEWEARADFGPIEHRVRIENLSGQEIWLPMVDSLRLDWTTQANKELHNLYVEKGAGSPSPHGTHVDKVNDGYSWTGQSSTYAFNESGGVREIIPAEFVFDAARPEAGWYAGIEFSGRTRISLERSGDSVKSMLGLNPDPGPFRTRLVPGGSFETPTVFLGAFTGGVDGAGNQLRPWVRAVLNNPLTWKDPHYPFTVNNSWGSGMQVDEALARRMIGESKELGLEMFGLDAGWFRGVGDWYPNPKKFPHGLAAIADEAHRQGLRFGIWVDWTQAALDDEPGALNARDPKVKDWLVADLKPGWKPEDFKGQTIDIGAPAARDYAAHEVKRMVEDYKLDMLEHDGYLVAQGCVRDDHPHAPPNMSTAQVHHSWGSDIVRDANSTDVSYHAVRAYYSIYEKLRKEHPGLLFEICNDGGRMVDFGTAAHGDYFSITDTYDPLSNRRAFFDTSHLLPAAMMESYVEKWPTLRIENFNYMLRSGMMGWLTVMLDTTQWTPEQHDAARSAITLYKQELRPLIRDAQLYHVSDRPDGVHWDGMEYCNPATGKGVVFAFRGTVADESEHRFVLAGLNPEKHYRLHFEDKTAPDTTTIGRDLMEKGLTVRLPQINSSELVFLSETSARN